MTRYIDADALKDCIEKEVYTHDYIEHVYQIIDEFPTADVVEVVRCKDCRCGYPEIENDNGKIEVYYYCDGDCCYHSGNDYCSDGERSE